MISWDGSRQTIIEALIDAEHLVHADGMRAVRAVMPRSAMWWLAYGFQGYSEVLKLRGDGSADLWTASGVIRIIPSDSAPVGEINLYDESNNLVANITIP